jgi:hypothetical protein
MKIVCGMATTNERMQFADKAIKSIISQVNDLHLYNNSVNIDRADNGKYWGLFLYHKEPVYYLTLDDDIIYPQGYVDNILNEVEKHGCIVSHHGRILKGTGLEYYTGHKAFAFFQENQTYKDLDVYGDGVAAFRSDYFNPKDMPFNKSLRMADTLVSLEMWKQGKRCVHIKHGHYEIKPMRVPTQLTISGTRNERTEEKNKLADEIYLLKNSLYI